MSEDTRETATCGDNLLPKSYSTELQDVTSGLDDADEKKALASPDAKAEVKFLSADSQNGDAIIDVDNVRAAFSGMGKEELMKFANDPFWVRTRWVLFVGFWVLWVAMIAGAIAVIIHAPKCSSQPRRWWEQSPLYSVDSLPGDLSKVQDLESYLKRLSKIGVDGAILPPVFNTGLSSNPDAVVDFKAVKPDIGTLEDFKQALKKIKENGGHVIMEIAPGHTSKEHEWFKRSAKNDDRYKDYYVRVNSTLKNNLSPSEWGKDWEQGGAFMPNSDGSTFYLRQSSDDLPVLNLTNPAVIAEIEDIMRFWLDAGVSGFQIRHSSNIFSVDRLNLPKGTLLTQNVTSQGVSIIQKLHAVVTNHTKDSVLILHGDVQSSFQDKITGLVGVLNSPISLITLQDGFTAALLKDAVERPVNESATRWPLWEISDSSVKTSLLPPGLMNGLLMTTMLLPGTVIVHQGSLLDLPAATNISNDTVTTAPKTVIQRRTEILKDLATVRKTMDSVNFGQTNVMLVNGSDGVNVFTLTRIKSGNPGILVVLNPSPMNTSVNLSGLDKVSEELTVHSLSFETGGDAEMQPKSKLSSNAVNLPGKSAVVFTFVPKKDS